MKRPAYASFIRRLAAAVVDSLILNAATLALLLSVGTPFDSAKLTIKTGSPPSITLSLSVLLSAVYVIGFWVKRDGQTPGKRLMHIKVITETGKPIDWFTGFVRYIGYYVSGAALGIGYLWMLFDSNKQTWHDKIAKTAVVEADDQKPRWALVALGCLIPLVVAAALTALVLTGVVKGYKNAATKHQTTRSLNRSLAEMDPEAKAHFDRSQDLFAQMKTIQNDPTSVKKRNDENIAELKKALEIDPDNARIWAKLSAAYTWVSSSGTIQDGIDAAVKAAEIDPQNAVYVADLGYMLMLADRNDDAILELNKAIRLDSNYARPHYLLGNAYTTARIYDQARSHFQQAIDIYSKFNKDGQFDDEILLAQKGMANLPK